MWISSAMDGNKQKGKWLVVEYKALKLLKQTMPPPQKIILMNS
jgi:hypothetical protein